MNKIESIISDLGFRNAYLKQLLRELSEVIENEEINDLLDEIEKNEKLIEILKEAL